jgi:hypothetical protein
MALAILKALAPKTVSLKFEIHKRLAGWEEPRPHFPLRASDLMKTDSEFCPREHAFMDMGLVKKRATFVGTSLRMTFNHGKFMEEKIREEYLRDLAVGNWVCGVCGKEHPTFGKAPLVTCSSCSFLNWKYIEPRFADDYAGVSGGVDVLLDIGQPKLLLTEIKTMAPDMFKTLAAPLAEHKLRTSLYLYLASVSTWNPASRINTKEARILYVSKSFGFKDDTLRAAGIKDAAFSPFKEFTIKRDDSLLKGSLSKSRAIKVWRDTKTGMPCGICPNGLTKRAQTCPANAVCFSGKFPSTLTWLTPEGQPKHPGKVIAS